MPNGIAHLKVGHGGEQGMTAQVKEVVMNRYFLYFQNLHPYSRKDYLQRTLWSHVFIVTVFTSAFGSAASSTSPSTDNGN